MFKKRYSDILTKEVLKELIDSGSSAEKMATIFGVSAPTVVRYLREYNLSTPRLSHYKIAKILRQRSLTPMEKGMVIGTVLGDSYLNAPAKPYRDTWFVTEHSQKQKEFVLLKRNLFSGFCVSDLQERKKGSVAFCSITHSDLSAIYPLLYDAQGKKRVTEEALKLLNIPGLILWYFDDGHYSPCSYRYSFATHSFSLREQKLIRKWLFKKFKIKTTPLPEKREGKVKYWYLCITKDSKPIFERLLRNFMIPCMYHKIRKGVLGSPETTREGLGWSKFYPNYDIVRTLLKGRETNRNDSSPPKRRSNKLDEEIGMSIVNSNGVSKGNYTGSPT